MPVVHEAQALNNSASSTTSYTMTAPAAATTGRLLTVFFISRDHTSGTAQPSVSGGGLTWTQAGSSTNRKLQLWSAVANGSTVGATITVSGCVGSCTGGLDVWSGQHASAPITNVVFEANASGNESHATFTPTNADSFVCFGVGNATNDTGIEVTVMAAATLGTLEPELWTDASTGGSDCYIIFTGKLSAGGPTATGTITWSQTNSATDSLSFAIAPVPAPNDGAATGSIAWAGTVNGTAIRSGAASGSVAWVGSSTGVRSPQGAGSGSVAWAGTADGDSPVVVMDGTATGSITWAGTATGTSVHSGSATGTVGWAGTANGTALRQGDATGSITWTGSATGSTTRTGASTGSITWVGSAAGESPGVGVQEGSADGAITWTGTATGQSTHHGTGVGNLTWVGSAVGARLSQGISTGSLTWTGTATGLSPTGIVLMIFAGTSAMTSVEGGSALTGVEAGGGTSGIEGGP